jgi:hypothetical protein
MEFYPRRNQYLFLESKYSGQNEVKNLFSAAPAPREQIHLFVCTESKVASVQLTTISTSCLFIRRLPLRLSCQQHSGLKTIHSNPSTKTGVTLPTARMAAANTQPVPPTIKPSRHQARRLLKVLHPPPQPTLEIRLVK